MIVDGQQVEPAFVCKIDETEQQEEPPIPKIIERIFGSEQSLARHVIDSREILAALYANGVKRDLMKALSFLAYACEVPARRKKVPVDVDMTVKAWLPLIKQLACAHDVDDKDAASSALDDHLLPILGAPVAQIREFYRKLTAALKGYAHG